MSRTCKLFIGAKYIQFTFELLVNLSYCKRLYSMLKIKLLNAIIVSHHFKTRPSIILDAKVIVRELLQSKNFSF